jgi:uncharacterized protein (TIGR00159 family)
VTLLFQIGFLEIKLVDIIDIGLVSVLLYQLYKLMRGSVAIKVFLGFLSLYLIFLVVKAAQMELLSSILGQFMGVGVIAVIILFQPEIRKFLLLIGRTTSVDRETLINNLLGRRDKGINKVDITQVIEAVKSLGGANIGALIVFSRNSPLKFYAESGDLIDAHISKRLLLAIFNKVSPLHDGAVILYRNKIVAARCILPITDQESIPAHYGLRHRAALGMSETSDSLVLVVSEETGQMSLAKNGKMMDNLSAQELRAAINNYLYEVEQSKPDAQDKVIPEPDQAAPESDKDQEIAQV